MTESSHDGVVDERLTTAVAGNYDVIVCGGGPAGVCAATAAARSGARTLLIESNGCLGGVWTSGLLSAVIDANKPGSILSEITGALRTRGAYHERSRSNFLYFPEAMKIVVEDLCVDAGVDIRLGSRVVAVDRDRTRICHVITESKAGRQAWAASVVIDCTGDGDVAARAGCGFDYGNDQGLAQPASLLGVVTGFPAELSRQFWDHTVADRKVQLHAEFARAGVSPTYGDPTLFHIGGDFFTLMSNHEYGVRPDDTAALTAATLSGRREVHRTVDALRGLGGLWSDLVLVTTAEQLGIREARRIHGRTTLVADDLANGVIGDDAVTVATFAMDVHSPDPAVTKGIDKRGRKQVKPYGIPYRSLVSADLDNLMMAGRCISGDFMAHASYRVTGNATATGEAAGRAAAYCAHQGLAPSQITWSQVLTA